MQVCPVAQSLVARHATQTLVTVLHKGVGATQRPQGLEATQVLSTQLNPVPQSEA